jgi:hypothetical protein
MKFIFSDRVTKEETVDYTVTNSYIELEMPFSGSISAYLYLLPRGNHSAFVLACLDDTFDGLVANMDEDTVDIICDTWPTLANLMSCGLKDKYSNGALIRLEDEDCGDIKWFVASIAGNLSFDSMEEVFSPRMMETIRLVLEQTVELITELQERKPSKLKAIGKGFWEGMLTGLAVWLDESF